MNKNKSENHSHFNSSLNKWGINLGKIKSKSPLNCKCGSRNLEYQKKKGDLWAECSDCGGKFQVSSVLAPHLSHLVVGGEP